MGKLRYQRHVKAAPHVAGIATPANTVLPVITGDVAGETSTTSDGTWNNASAFKYQWYLDGVAIAGEITNSIDTSVDWLDQTLTVVVSGCNGAGCIEATSLGVVLGIDYTGPLDLVPGALFAFGQRAMAAADIGEPIYTVRKGGQITSSTLAASGIGWKVNDTFIVQGGNDQGLGTVDTVSPAAFAAAITGIAITSNETITAVVQGAKTFAVAGDQTARLHASGQFTVSNSSGNDGTYTVVSAVFGATTVITVSEVIPDATADGHITIPGVVTVAGSHAASFQSAGLVAITASTGNDGSYLIQFAAVVGGNTNVYLDPSTTLSDATVDGTLTAYGAIATYHLTSAGSAYTTTSGVSIVASSGLGDEATLNITCSASSSRSFNSDASGDAPVSDISSFIGSELGYISVFNDGSGNGYDALQASSVSQFQWDDSVTGGRPGFLNIASSKVETDGSIAVSAGAQTIILVVSGDGAVDFVSLQNSVSGDQFCSIGLDGDSKVNVIITEDAFETQSLYVTSGTVGTGTHVISVTIAANGVVAVKIDGVDGSAALQDGYVNVSMGSDADGGVILQTNTSLEEALWYCAAVSAPNILALTENAADYYGITI